MALISDCLSYSISNVVSMTESTLMYISERINCISFTILPHYSLQSTVHFQGLEKKLLSIHKSFLNCVRTTRNMFRSKVEKCRSRWQIIPFPNEIAQLLQANVARLDWTTWQSLFRGDIPEIEWALVWFRLVRRMRNGDGVQELYLIVSISSSPQKSRSDSLNLEELHAFISKFKLMPSGLF